MEHIYPAGPDVVPENLTQPTTAYKQRAWIALAGLALFVALYFFLAGWFVWTAWRLINGALGGGSGAFMGWGLGAAAAFLAVFMIKALVFVKHGGKSDDTEITAEQQPALFDFLHRLADETGAPRPHRVYLSPRVNAAVFYDLSILNLVFPSRKNLEIGLGLVNVLTLGEFKAVIAHEFGHFAQRSMAVGSWVYIGQQIAAHIVAKRDALDNFLQGLSRVDLRIAWIGWVLRLIVWSIRSLVETVFNGVAMAQRALSRQMEMQADLVAVSVTGSDALIHALSRIQVGDEAWSRALMFANTELTKGRVVKDIFAVQTRAITRIAAVLDDVNYGNPPPLPMTNPAAHRIFKAEIAHPPQMWSSHPFNHEREENAKRVYVAAPLDARSAWAIFKEPGMLREQVTAQLMPSTAHSTDNAVESTEESLAQLDREYDREFFKRFYRGAYLGRSPVRNAARAEELYGTATTNDLSGLYPDSLAKDLEQLRNFAQEKALLENLASGNLKAPEGVIRHRGKVLAAKELPQAISAIGVEMAELEARISEHDRRCRSAHRAAAAVVKRGWEEHLVGTAAVLHYADHAEASVRDAQRFLANTVHVVIAGGRASDAGIKRVLNAANELYAVLKQVFEQQGELVLDSALASRMEITQWRDVLEEFKLSAPAKDNLNEWIKVIDGWVDTLAGSLAKLRLAALEQLLSAETQVARHFREGAATEDAPPPSKVPLAYPVLPPGKERALQTKLGWWARFQNSIGVFPTAARLLVALGIIGGVLGFAGSVGVAKVTIYNGLALPVKVKFGDKSALVTPASVAHLEFAPDKHYAVETQTVNGRAIESFDADVHASFGQYIYNVASASPLIDWQVVYGSGTARADKMLGAPRWLSTTAEVLFEEPPKQVRSKSGGATKDVLAGFGNLSPNIALQQLTNEQDRERVIATHAKWDPANSPHIMLWLAAAQPLKEFPAILAARLKENPLDIVSLRFEQEAATADEKVKVCARQEALAQSKPDNASLQYLRARCVPDRQARDVAFVNAYRAAPQNGWTAYAAAYVFAEQESWAEANTAFETARKNERVLAGDMLIDLARVRRMQAADGKGDLSDLAKQSEQLAYFLMMESTEARTMPSSSSLLKAYAELTAGNIPRALEFIKPSPEAEPRLLLMAAASDGADAALAARALALPTDKLINSSTIWIALALATKQKAEMTPYIAKANQLAAQFDKGEVDTMLRVLEAMRSGASVETVEAAMKDLRHELRGHAYAMGLIVRGTAAPAKWREGAKRLLFVAERPYFS